jgi:hypothetical protein
MHWVETEKYIRSLPQGIHSFPDCVTRAEITLAMLEEFPALLSASEAPPDLMASLRCLKDPQQYLPEALFMSARHMLMDSMKNEADFIEWHHQVAKRVFLRPLYRALMFVMSPSLVLTNATKRWTAFRRGTHLESKVSKHEAHLTLHFPPGLYTPLIQRALGQSFRAAVEVAGGRDASSTVSGEEPGRAYYVVRWR